MRKISGRLRKTSIHAPASDADSGLQVESRASARSEPERPARTTIAIDRDLEVDQEPLEDEPGVVAGDEPLPVVGVEEVAHRRIAYLDSRTRISERHGAGQQQVADGGPEERLVGLERPRLDRSARS